MHPLPSSVKFFERGWLSSNSVLIEDANQSILVDSGYWTHAPQTHALIASALGDRALTALVNTHLHSDHCGGNAFFQEKYPQLRIYIPPGHATFVDRWDPVALTYAPTGQHCPAFTRTDLLHDGDSFVVADQTWHVHAAPGHDPHSIVLFNHGHGILISADALWENGFGVVFPEIEGLDAYDDVECTLDLIEQLGAKLVLPGHGAAFTDISGALARARTRLTQFREAPAKHATYAAKVLLKFKLLELQKIKLQKFLAWGASTSYLKLLHTQHAEHQSFETWFIGMCKSLEKSGACSIENMHVINC